MYGLFVILSNYTNELETTNETNRTQEVSDRVKGEKYENGVATKYYG